MAIASRRGFLAAFTAFTGAAGAGGVALASVAAPASDPDRELLAAGATWAKAVEAFQEATSAYEVAACGLRDALGFCPPELNAHGLHAPLFHRIRIVSGKRIDLAWDRIADDNETGEAYVNRWDGESLRHVIKWLPKANGPGGRTPNAIRHLKALLPIADARDAADAFWTAHYDTSRLYGVLREAREAATAAEKPILALPAATLAGVRVKAQLASYRLAEWAKHSPGTHHQSEYLTCIMDAALAVGGASS